jgi:hypothetical protein
LPVGVNDGAPRHESRESGPRLAAEERSRECADRLARRSALQRRFDPLPVDNTVADSYGRLAARVVEIGRRPRARTMDRLIATILHGGVEIRPD